jgi:GNAT superfamily N-acetyltransferase
VRALLVAVGALVLAGTVGAAGEPVTVLPKPHFNAPAGAPTHERVTFRVVSSTPFDPGRLTPSPKPHGLRIEGPDAATTHLVIARGRYAFDFGKYAWPPHIAPGEREFVYEQVVWAKEAGGVLYVETAHSTYARSSSGLNAYLNAIDVKRKTLLWRSPALVANARNFVVLDGVIVSGYGFTAEPDYLYAVDRAHGRVVGRILLPTAADRIARHGNTLTVDTYDHRLTIRVSVP